MEEILKLVAIKTKDKVYISNNIKGDGYTYGVVGLDSYLFDGETPINNYIKSWYEIKQIPQKIEKIIPSQRINARYELKEGFPITEKTPKIINLDYIDDESIYYEVKGLYERKYDLTEESKEDVEFKITILDELEDFEPIKEEVKLEYNLIDRLKTHPILLPTKPCKLSSEESYKIIRNFVKNHIDSRYAHITSDYDFCFAVKKKIQLAKEVPYEVDVANLNNWGKKRKPKYETRYRKEREVPIFETAPLKQGKVYDGYTMTQPVIGENYDDLQSNINSYLKELIDYINKPLIECPHCDGLGVILNNLEKFK